MLIHSSARCQNRAESENLYSVNQYGKDLRLKNTTKNDILKQGFKTQAFDEYLGEFVTTVISEDNILQTGTVEGTAYKLTIRLRRWAGKTTPEQIVILSRLFWQCYPRMYRRFGKAGNSPTRITLNIEDRGYEIAWQSENLIHLHDGWLQRYPNDFDCITHELAHAIQNGWDDGRRLEYDDYIERFADVCRYLYAFNNGEYNDPQWELGTAEEETHRKDSNRFPVWFDYQYSTPECDLLLNYFTVCRSEKYPTHMWKEAWAEIFKGSALEGRDIEDVWNEYKQSEFASLSTHAENGTSPLLEKYDVRGRVK